MDEAVDGIKRTGEAGPGRRRSALVVALALLVSLGFSAGYASVENPSGYTFALRPHADGIHYYAYARSLLLDGDLDFDNDYLMLIDPFPMGRTKTGKAGNVFTIGPTIFWLPTFALAHGWLSLSNRWLGTDDPLDGSTVAYSRLATSGSLLWGLLAALLVGLMVRRFVGFGASLATTLAMLLATPLPWYVLFQPAYSHASSAFATTAFVAWWLRTHRRRTARQWTVLGLLLGLAMDVRPQNALHVVLPLGEWLALAWAARRDRAGLLRLVGHGALFAATTLIAFLPQMAAWKVLYGEWITVPQGEDFMLWDHSEWVRVLFATRNGLLAWHPIFALSLIGLLLAGWRLHREGSPYRAAPWLMLLAIWLQAYVNGATADWYAGFAFGGRRMLSCLPYFGFGLAFALQEGARWLAAPRPLARGLLMGVALAPFVLLNAGMLLDFPEHGYEHDANGPMRATWSHATDIVLDGLYATVGNPVALPAALPFALRFGTWPGAYDVPSSAEFFAMSRAREARLDLRASMLGVAGFGKEAVQVARRRAVPVLGSRAVAALPLRRPLDLEGEIDVHPAHSGQRLRLLIEGTEVLRSGPLPRSWKRLRFSIPRRLLDSGIHRLELRCTTRPLRFPVGETGARLAVDLTVRSQSFQVGNRAVFTVGREATHHRRRGLVAYRCDGSRCHFVTTFDTFFARTEADRFVRFVRRLPPGTVVGLAVSDEASRRWTDEADRALRSLGAPADFSMKGRWRHSVAFVGAKGAPPGTALLQANPKSPAEVTVGRPLPLRFDGVAVSRFVLRRR